MSRNLAKMEEEGHAVQWGSKMGLSVAELIELHNAYLDKRERGEAGLTDLIFQCFSIGAAAGVRHERKRQSKRRRSAAADRNQKAGANGFN